MRDRFQGEAGPGSSGLCGPGETCVRWGSPQVQRDRAGRVYSIHTIVGQRANHQGLTGKWWHGQEIIAALQAGECSLALDQGGNSGDEQEGE